MARLGNSDVQRTFTADGCARAQDTRALYAMRLPYEESTVYSPIDPQAQERSGANNPQIRALATTNTGTNFRNKEARTIGIGG